ncbi:hypothetical protein BH09PAT1_BH09PAT1_2510 [soil metagenome]
MPFRNLPCHMEKVKKFLIKTKHSYRTLPDKKQYIEFFTAALTVPMLLTVIIINLNNLRSNKAATPIPTPTQDRPIVVTLPNTETKVTVTPQPSTVACKKGIGSISIGYPDENSVISENPVQIDINYQQGDYCAVVWSYRINDGNFSNYDDKSIALYNVPSGPIRFQLKVKSIVTGEEKTLTRNFTYKGSSDSTPVASGSAN